MTGVLNAMVASGNGQPFTVTVASTGAGSGFLSGSGGAISPTSFKGSSIRQIASNISPEEFRFELSAVVAQGIFSYLVVIDADNVAHRFRSANATYSNPGGTRSLWQWATDEAGNAGDDIWTALDWGDRQVLIYL